MLTRLDEISRDIAINLLKKGVSVENVYKMIGLSDEERNLKSAGYWDRICAAVDDKNTKMSVYFRAIINERICEIIKKLKTFGISFDQISEITNLTKEEIEKI